MFREHRLRIGWFACEGTLLVEPYSVSKDQLPLRVAVSLQLTLFVRCQDIIRYRKSKAMLIEMYLEEQRAENSQGTRE